MEILVRAHCPRCWRYQGTTASPGACCAECVPGFVHSGRLVPCPCCGKSRGIHHEFTHRATRRHVLVCHRCRLVADIVLGHDSWWCYGNLRRIRGGGVPLI